MIIDEEHRIGDLLRAVEPPPSNADLARAIASGRRRRRRRGVVAVAAATALVTAVGIGAVAARRTVTGPAQVAAANCSVAVLPNLPGHVTRAVYAVDPTGRYTVGMSGLLAKPAPGDTPSTGWEHTFVLWDGTAEPVGRWT